MKRRATVLAASFATAVGTTSSFADTTDIEPLIVTATRTAQTVDETLASVSVITRRDIERSQAKSVMELLDGLAGLDFNVSGGYGKTTGLFLRGTNSDHVVVLIDGMRVGSASLGEISWEYLAPEQIERIEVVRGPRSSLYGADAVGGVIQIFTRRGQERVEGGVSAGYGTHRSEKYAAHVSGTADGTDYSVSASRFKTAGINARQPAPEYSGGPLYSEPDTDGYYNDSGSARIGHRFAGGAEIAAHVAHAQGHSDYDGSYVNETDFLQNVTGVDARFSPMERWNVKLQSGRSRDETDNFKDGIRMSVFNTDRRTQSWQNDLLLARRQLLTLGIDRQTDSVESTTDFVRTSRRNTGYFAQHQAGLGPHDVIVGLRRDDNEAFGRNTTGNAAWGYAISGERLRVFAAYGTAFKAPTFNQLYDPYVGNPDIRPEKSKSSELGLRGREPWGTWSLRGYRTDIEDLIVFQPPTYQALNIARARIRGLESEIKARTDLADFSLSATVLDPRDADTGKLLPRRAQRSLRLDAERAFGRLQLGGDWLVQGARYDDPANTVRLGGYGLVNLHAQYALDANWFVRARADNVFDKTYETAATYNSLGRAYFVTLGYQTR